MGTDDTVGVVTLVCLTCGKEQYFAREVPATVACSQCGGTVFRTFDTPTEPDDADSDALEAPVRLQDDGDDPPTSSSGDTSDSGVH